MSHQIHSFFHVQISQITDEELGAGVIPDRGPYTPVSIQKLEHNNLLSPSQIFPFPIQLLDPSDKMDSQGYVTSALSINETVLTKSRPNLTAW